jgi:hypothetical protein
LANKHNPAIASKDWLTQKNIIEEEITKFTHLPVVSLIETENFELVVDLDRLQLSIKKISPENLETLPQIIFKYMSKLPETPYTAIGFNYSYHIEIDQMKLKNLLLINDKKLTEIFTESYMFGILVKFQYKDFKVTLTLNPINGTKIKVDFNFHFESNKIESLLKNLYEHSQTKKTTEEILGGLYNV